MSQTTTSLHSPIWTATTPRMPGTGHLPQQTRVGKTGISLGGACLALIVPSDEGERQAQAMENWFQACSSDEPFALELVGTTREQGFVLRASSETQLMMLCKQLEAQYPQVAIQRIDPNADPLMLRAGEHAVIGEFALAQPAWLPIKTFSGKALAEPGADPLAGILANMEAVRPGSRIIAQFALVRAPESWLSADIRKSVEHALQPERDKLATSLKHTSAPDDIAEGTRLICMMALAVGGFFAYRWFQAGDRVHLLLLSLFFIVAFGILCWWKLNRKKVPIYDMKLVAEKMARASFYTHVRLIAIGKKQRITEQELHQYVSMMEVAYRQFSIASSNSLYVRRTRLLKYEDHAARRLISAQKAFPYSPWLLRLLHGGAYSKTVLNGLELAGLFHLPQEGTDLPLVRRTSFKGLLASPEIAYQIQQMPAPQAPALIGYSRHRRHSVPVYLPFDALFSHKCFVGMSRSGKSVLIQLLTRAAMQPLQKRYQGTILQPGVFVADPHRDLIMDILKLIPPSRKPDVLLLDMTDTQFPVALNPLDASMGFTRDQAVSNLMASFQKVWAEYWGPRMAYFLNSVCLLLYTLNERLVQQNRAEEQYTLLDINPLLQYKDYAIQVLSQLDMSVTWHQELLAWWQNTYFTLPANSSFRQEIIMPILSKIGVFHDNTQLRRIVGQAVTRAPVHQAVTEGKIVLCALAARDMDDSAVNILGSTLINLLHRSFGMQQATPLKERRKVFVAIDEFQNFSGSDFDKLLSEDAKYGCALLLATQNLKRLNKIRDGLLEMVLSNCQQLCVFRISAADAQVLEAELQEKVTIKHIISQPPLHCYARLTMQGHPLQIVSVGLAQPASWAENPESVRLVEEIRRSNQHRSLPVAEVDQRYEEHLRRFLNIKAYASKLQREAHAVQVSQQQRDVAEQLAQELDEQQATSADQSSLNPQSGQETPKPNPVSSPGGSQKKPSRNHRRSRRKGKQQVGAPPPQPQDTSPKQDTNADGNPRPLPFPAGTHWRSPSGRERSE